MKNYKLGKLLKAINFSIIFIILFALLANTTIGFSTSYADEEVNNSTKLKETEEDTATTDDIDIYDIQTLTNALFGDVIVYSSEFLYSLDGNADYIYVEFENGGYAVFYKDTMELLEYSVQGQIDYSTIGVNCYCGPCQYYIKYDNDYVDIVSGDCITLSEEDALAYSEEIRNILSDNDNSVTFDYSSVGTGSICYEDISVSTDNIDPDSESTDATTPEYDRDSLIHITDGNYISNYRYFLAEPLHGDNTTGTCAAVATQLMLSYNNYYNDRRIIDDKYLNGGTDDPESNPNLCTDPMLMNSYTLGTRGNNEDGSDDDNSYFKYIISYIPANASINLNSTALNSILQARNKEIDGEIDYNITTESGTKTVPVDSSGIIEEIDSGRPVEVLLQDSLGGTDHSAVAYGYSNYTYPDTSTSYLGYITHFGWKTNSESYLNIWVNSSWCRTYVTLKINHTHSYNTVGTIGTTDRTEYKCSTCGHRTDAAINALTNSRYEERVVALPDNNGYTYKDYYVTFSTAGNKLFQTFGSADTLLYLYDSDYNQLAYDDDSGYAINNALFSYTVQADTPYFLRVQFNNTSKKGSIRVAITPADTVYADYYDIERAGSYSTITNLSVGTTKVLRYTVPANGTYTFDLISSYDNFLYIIDPSSTEKIINNVDYNDDGGSGNNASLTKELYAGRSYFIICSKYNPNSSFSSTDSSTISLSAYISGDTTPIPSYLELQLISRSGFIIYNWEVQITNPNSYIVQVTYNSKMCFESDAKNYTNLSDLVTIMIPANSSETVTIYGNGTAAWITTCIDYTYKSSNYRGVTCATGLSSSLTMNTPVNTTISYS